MDENALTIALIAAVAENGVIGRDGKLPWHYPEDLGHFKKMTLGHPVVMGRRTYESIVAGLGEPLPGRTNIVLTSGELDAPDGVVRADSVEDAIDLARTALTEGDPIVYVIGGASVYEQFLDRADRLVLTEIHGAYEGDTYFPKIDWSGWEEIERDEREELSFVTYDRSA